MNEFNFKIITDLEEAEKAWNEFSPHFTIDDEWAFRFAFIKHLNYELYFIAGYDGEKLVGLLPLQKNNLEGLRPPYGKEVTKPFLEFFGGDDTDDNVVLLKPGYGEYVNQFFEQIPIKAYLAPLAKSYTSDSVPYTNKYLVNIEGVKDYFDYIESKVPGSSSRKTLRKRAKHLYANYKIELIYNNYEDLALISQISIQRFGVESSFNFPYRQQIFEDLTKLYQVETITIMVDGKKEGVSYGIKYKDVYVGMNAGVNHEIRDLGKLLSLLQIDRAIQLGCKAYDGGKGSGVWKEEFGFQIIPQYRLDIN